MFIYLPLSNTLKEKKIDLEQLCQIAGLNKNLLICKMNNKEYISLQTLDKICNALQEPVEKVIKWETGDQSSPKKINVDWEVVTEQLSVKGLSLNELSEKCRLDRSSLSHSKIRNSKIPEWTVKLMASALNVNFDDLVKK